MPVLTAGGRVLRRRDLPDEEGGRSQGLTGRVGRGYLPRLLGGVSLPLKARRRRRVGAAHAVRAGGVVPAGFDAPHLNGIGRELLPDSLPGRVSRMNVGVSRVVFRAGRLKALTRRVTVVGGDVFRPCGCSLAPQMGAGRGGEYAAPAAQDQGPGETKIYKLSRQGF